MTCDFCKVDLYNAEAVVRGMGGSVICKECILLCVDILADPEDPHTKPPPRPLRLVVDNTGRDVP